MDAKRAIKIAKSYVAEVFGDEGARNIGLEEIERENGLWRVTVGFSRPWDAAPQSFLDLAIAPDGPPPRRVYKIVSVQDQDGTVTAVKNRDVVD